MKERLTARFGGGGPHWRDPVFRRFYTAHVVSFAGSQATLVILPVLAYQRTASAALPAALTAIQTVPYLAFGLMAGAIADRANRRRMMVTADIVAALAVGSVPLAEAFDRLTTAHLIVAAAVTATCFVWFDAANFGALPAIVGRDQIVAATSAIWVADGLLFIAAPAAAGVFIAVTGAAAGLWFDAASYLVSAGVLLTIHHRFRTTEPVVSGRPMRADVVDGLRYLLGLRLVRT